MIIQKLNVDRGEWASALQSTEWFRIKHGGAWFDIQSNGDGIQTRTDAQISIEPTASNTIVVKAIS